MEKIVIFGAATGGFCYPYKEILEKLGVRFSFDVNYKDIVLKEILHSPPRYDCNLFEYGKSNLG